VRDREVVERLHVADNDPNSDLHASSVTPRVPAVEMAERDVGDRTRQSRTAISGVAPGLAAVAISTRAARIEPHG
jgi:hypothetical protein